MTEVLGENFNLLYPQLEDAIKNANFIAIDSEFTGIHSEANLKNSLFDTLDDRYNTFKRNIKDFIILQFGITVFCHVPSENAYKAKCFNFYLFPKAIPFKNRQFSCQAAALEFLSKHNFKFDKFIYNGISYLNEEDEDLLRQHLEQDNIINNLQHLTYEEEDDLKNYKIKINEWFTQNSNIDSGLKLTVTSPILRYIIIKILRSDYKNVFPILYDTTIEIIKVTDVTDKLLNANEDKRFEKEFLDYCLGFSKIFKLLTSTKKVIIGHNLLLDLMFMHQQFYKPLPVSYKEFKSNVHMLFPQIYDTKFLSYELKNILGTEKVNWKINSLGCLFKYFSNHPSITFNSPKITFDQNCPDNNSYHTAGWDSYFAGYIFIKMGHIFCVRKFGIGLEERTVTHSELMSGVKDFVNCINITRGNELYMNFSGTDPTLSRPEWLHVKLNSPLVDSSEVINIFSSFGRVDVMPVTKHRVLVAVANHYTARNILQHFKSDKNFQVVRYNRIRHAPPSTIYLWSGIFLCGGAFAWMFKNILTGPKMQASLIE